MDVSDLDIYNDLDAFHEEEQKKTAEFLQLEEKYKEALKAIVELNAEITKLRKQEKTIRVNFQNLLYTAKAEIKRKDAQIQQLRKEKDDICFRRKISTFPNQPNNQKVNPFKSEVESTYFTQQSSLPNSKSDSETKNPEEKEDLRQFERKYNYKRQRSPDETASRQEQLSRKHHKSRHREDYSNRYENAEHQKFSRIETTRSHEHNYKSRESSTHSNRSHSNSKDNDETKKDLRRELSAEQTERKYDSRYEKPSSSHSWERTKEHKDEKTVRDSCGASKASLPQKSCSDDRVRDIDKYSQDKVKDEDKKFDRPTKDSRDSSERSHDRNKNLRHKSIRDDGHDKCSADASVLATDVTWKESSISSEKSHSNGKDTDKSKKDERSAKSSERKNDYHQEKASSHSSQREKERSYTETVRDSRDRDRNKTSHDRHRRKHGNDGDREREHVKYSQESNDKNEKNYLEKTKRDRCDRTKSGQNCSVRLEHNNIYDNENSAVLGTDAGSRVSENDKSYLEKDTHSREVDSYPDKTEKESRDQYESNRKRKKSSSSNDTCEHRKESTTDNKGTTAEISSHSHIEHEERISERLNSCDKITTHESSREKELSWAINRSEGGKKSHSISKSDFKESFNEDCKMKENLSKYDNDSGENLITKEQITSEVEVVIADTESQFRNSSIVSISKEIPFSSTTAASKQLLSSEIDENSNHPTVNTLDTPKKAALFDKLFGPSPCAQNTENTKLFSNDLQIYNIYNSHSISTSPSAYSTYSDVNELEQKNSKSNDSVEQKSQNITSAEVASYFTENTTQNEINYQETKEERKSFFDNICGEKHFYGIPGIEVTETVNNELENERNENADNKKQNIHLSVNKNDVKVIDLIPKNNSKNGIDDIIDTQATRAADSKMLTFSEEKSKEKVNKYTEKNETQIVNLQDREIAVTNNELKQHNYDAVNTYKENQITSNETISEVFDLTEDECDKLHTQNIIFELPVEHLHEIANQPQTFDAKDLKEVENILPVANKNKSKMLSDAQKTNVFEIVDDNKVVNKTDNEETLSYEKTQSKDSEMTVKIDKESDLEHNVETHLTCTTSKTPREPSEIIEKQNITAAVSVVLPVVKEKGINKFTETVGLHKKLESKLYGDYNDIIEIDDDTDVDVTDVETADEEISFYKAKLDTNQCKATSIESNSTSKVKKAIIEIIEDIRLPSVLPINQLLNEQKTGDVSIHTDTVQKHNDDIDQLQTTIAISETLQENITENLEICKQPEIGNITLINESFKIDDNATEKELLNKNDTKDKNCSVKENTAVDGKTKELTSTKELKDAEKLKTNNENLNNKENTTKECEVFNKTLISPKVKTVPGKQMGAVSTSDKESNVREIENVEISTSPFHDNKIYNAKGEEQYSALKYKSAQSKKQRKLSETSKNDNIGLEKNVEDISKLDLQTDKCDTNKQDVKTNEKSPKKISEAIIIEDSQEVVNILNKRTSISPKGSQYATPTKTATAVELAIQQLRELENNSKSKKSRFTKPRECTKAQSVKLKKSNLAKSLNETTTKNMQVKKKEKIDVATIKVVDVLKQRKRDIEEQYSALKYKSAQSKKQRKLSETSKNDNIGLEKNVEDISKLDLQTDKCDTNKQDVKTNEKSPKKISEAIIIEDSQEVDNILNKRTSISPKGSQYATPTKTATAVELAIQQLRELENNSKSKKSRFTKPRECTKAQSVKLKKSNLAKSLNETTTKNMQVKKKEKIDVATIKVVDVLKQRKRDIEEQYSALKYKSAQSKKQRKLSETSKNDNIGLEKNVEDISKLDLQTDKCDTNKQDVKTNEKSPKKISEAIIIEDSQEVDNILNKRTSISPKGSQYATPTKTATAVELAIQQLRELENNSKSKKSRFTKPRECTKAQSVKLKKSNLAKSLNETTTKNMQVKKKEKIDVATIKVVDVLKQRKRDIEFELESLNKISENNVKSISDKSATVETVTQHEKKNKLHKNIISKTVEISTNPIEITSKSKSLKLSVSKTKHTTEKTAGLKIKQNIPKDPYKHGITLTPKLRKRQRSKVRRLIDSSSDDEQIDNSSIIKAKSTEISEQLLMTMGNVVSSKGKQTLYNNLLYDSPTKASADVDELSPMSTAAHAIFYTDQNYGNTTESLLPQFNIIQDSQYKDIDSRLQTMFQSPPYQTDKMEQFKSAQFSPITSIHKEEESFSVGMLNNDQHNVTIDETLSIAAAASTAEQGSLTDSNTNLETKCISLNGSTYRFEKISDNVVNVFVTRKRRKKVTK